MGFQIKDCVLVKYPGNVGDVVIPDSVTSIGNGAFKGCKGLKSVTIPEGVMRIGDEAFRGCRKLQVIDLPNSVVYVGRHAFTDTGLPRPQGTLKGLTFVVTGDLASYRDRYELREVIESLGGRLTDSVSGKTDYLITNSRFSGTTKLQKARQLGVKIIDENEFLKLAGLW